MERPQITVLPQILRYTSVDWDIDWREQVAGTTVTGRRNIAIGRLPRWIGTPSLEFFRADIGLWRAARLSARGLTGVFRMVMRDAAVYAPPCGEASTFDDGSTFSDGTGFAAEYTVRCDAGAALGATEIVVNMSTANGTIQIGQIMSHNDWPFSVIEIDGNTLRVEPPLRAAIPAGDTIRLEGRGWFEMVDARTGNPSYNSQMLAQPTFALQEWLR
jgi:hypothetical protein